MEKLKINKKVLEQTHVVQLTNDIIVPDIKPDIINIIATNGIPYIYKEEIEKNRIKVEGCMDVYIVYLSVDGDTRSIQTTLNFKDFLENDYIKENSIIKWNLEIDTLNVKILNERKFTFNANLAIKYLVSEIQSVEIKDDFINDIPKLQIQEEKIKLKSLIGINTAKDYIKEDITIENLDEIAEILKVNVEINNFENKISYNKLLAKAEFNIDFVYITEDGRLGNVKNTFPVMSFVEFENIKEEDIVELDYIIKNMLIKLNNRDKHSITVQVDFDILCTAYEEKTVNILKDAYSLTNDLELSFETLKLEENEEKEYIEVLENVKVDDIKRVVSVDKRKIVILKQDKYNIEGEICLGLYYETIDKLGLSFKEIKIPFVTKFKEACWFEINSIDVSLTNENVNFIIKLLIKYSLKNNSQINIIDNIKIKDTNESEDYSVIVYSVKKNDTIWKIAKEFKITTETLKKINDLNDNDNINLGDKLYILK